MRGTRDLGCTPEREHLAAVGILPTAAGAF
jgi:hypothetical protein